MVQKGFNYSGSCGEMAMSWQLYRETTCFCILAIHSYSVFIIKHSMGSIHIQLLNLISNGLNKDRIIIFHPQKGACRQEGKMFFV